MARPILIPIGIPISIAIFPILHGEAIYFARCIWKYAKVKEI